MAFVIRLLFASAIVCAVNAGVLTGHHDSYVSSALSAPSASYGTPSTSYGPPALTGSSFDLHSHDHGHGVVDGGYVDDHAAHHVEHGSALTGTGALLSGHLDTSATGYSDSGYPASGYPSSGYPAAGYPSGTPFVEGGISLGASRPGPVSGSLNSGLPLGASVTTALGPPRVIGTSVTVGRPIAHETRYELQSVVQNVVRRVPIEVTRHVKVAVPQPVPVPVPHEVKVPVPQPYPVHVDVVKHVPYPVYKTQHVEVERPVPYEVVKQVPVEVIRKVPVPVERPYEVIKKVPVPVEKHVHVPVPVWKPYPLHIIKHVTHYKKKSCCW